MKFLQANGLPHPYVMLLLAPLFWATSNVTGKLGKAWLSPHEFTFWRWLLTTALLSLLFRARIRHDGPALRACRVAVGRRRQRFCAVQHCALQRLCPRRERGQCVDYYRADSAGGAAGGRTRVARAGASAAMVLRGAVVRRRGVGGKPWPSGGAAGTGHCAGRPAGAGIERDLCGLFAGAAARATDALGEPALGDVPGGDGGEPAVFRGGTAARGLAWALLGYVVLFVSIASKLFYMEGVIAIGANRAALTMNLLPVFGALVGAAFFADEHLGGYVLIALALVAAGIGLSERGARRLACPV